MKKAPALVVWAILAVVVLLGALPGPTGNARWPLAHRAASLKFGAVVVPLGERDVWAFGTRRFGYATFGPTAYRWDGERWRNGGLPAGVGGFLMSAGGSSPTNVWAVTSGDAAGVVPLRWDGREWTARERVPASSVEDMAVLGEDDVWLFGEHTWRRTRNGWSRAEVPMAVYRAAARSASDIWAIGWSRDDARREMIGHYDGRSWEVFPLGDVLPPAPSVHHATTGVTADASGVWITANVSSDVTQTTRPVLLSRTGGRWRTEEATAVAGAWRETFDPLPDGRGGHWFLGSTDANGYDSALAHRSAAGVWTLSPVDSAPGTAEFTTLAAVPGTSRLLATGRVGTAVGVFLHHAEP